MCIFNISIKKFYNSWGLKIGCDGKGFRKGGKVTRAVSIFLEHPAFKTSVYAGGLCRNLRTPRPTNAFYHSFLIQTITKKKNNSFVLYPVGGICLRICKRKPVISTFVTCAYVCPYVCTYKYAYVRC